MCADEPQVIKAVFPSVLHSCHNTFFLFFVLKFTPLISQSISQISCSRFICKVRYFLCLLIPHSYIAIGTQLCIFQFLFSPDKSAIQQRLALPYFVETGALRISWESVTSRETACCRYNTEKLSVGAKGHLLLAKILHLTIYKFREGVPYVKLYRYNPKHLCPNLNGY